MKPVVGRLLRGDIWALVHRLRNHLTDLVVLLPLASLGLWWENTRSDNSLSSLYFFEPGEEDQRFLVRVGAAQWIPVVMAVLVVLALRRHRSAVRHRSVPGSVYWADVCLRAGLVMVPAAIMLLSQFGGVATRYLPLCAGLLLLIALSWVSDHPIRRLRVPTRAGFRPSLSSLRSGPGRNILRAVHHASRPDDALAAVSNAVDFFVANGDPDTAGYCAALCIEAATAHADWDTAERSVALVDGRASLSGSPAVLAARSWFSDQIGDSGRAVHLLGLAFTKSRRPPTRLALLAGTGLSDLTLARLASALWRRMDDGVLQAALDHAHSPMLTPQDAFSLARQVQQCANDLLRDGRDQLDAASRTRVALLAGQAVELAAQLLVDQNEHRHAATLFFEAYRSYARIGYRPGTGRSLAAAATCTLRMVPAPVAPAMTESTRRTTESSHGDPWWDPALDPVLDQALDLARVGIHLMEETTGELRVVKNRTAAMTSAHQLHSDLLEQFAARKGHAKCGETALWLLEARKRSSLAAALVHTLGDANTRTAEADRLFEMVLRDDSRLTLGKSSSLAQLTDEQRHELQLGASVRQDLWAEVRKHRDHFPAGSATDISALLEHLGDSVALMYRAAKPGADWQFDIVCLSRRTGARHHRAVIDGSSEAGRRLDILENQSNPATAGLLAATYGKPMYVGLWAELSNALLPPDLIQTLARNSPGWQRSDRSANVPPPVLIIVPDGPLSSIPWSGLPMPDGTALIEHADVVMAAGITQLLRSPAGPGESGHRVLLHADTEVHSEQLAALRLTDSSEHLVTSTRTSDELRRELKTGSWDIAVIVGHGYLIPNARTQISTHRSAESGSMMRLADGSAFSDAAALETPWPQTVALVNCWLGHVRTEDGHSAVGFPVACLLGGATIILGSVGPLDAESGPLLVSSTIRAHLAGGPLVRHFGEHMRAALAAEQRELGLTSLHGQRRTRKPPTGWASLTLWTTVSPSTNTPTDDLPRYWESADLTPARRASTREKWLAVHARIPQLPVATSQIRDAASPKLSATKAYYAFSGLLLIVLMFAMVTMNNMRDAGATSSPPGAIGAVIGPIALLNGSSAPGFDQLTTDGPATAVGIRPGDVIFSIDGSRVYTALEACNQLRRHPPGTPTTMLIEHAGAVSQRTVRLTTRTGSGLDRDEAMPGPGWASC